MNVARLVGMIWGDLLARFGGHAIEDRPFECTGCGNRYALQYFSCPDCGSYDVDRVEWELDES